MVFYVRSSSGDKALMESQVRQLEIAYGKPARVFKDTSSGLNENRRGLQSLINNARKRTISTICITDKDRLTRFGYTYLQELLNEYGVTIQVLHENDDKPLQEELMNDFMNLIASFSGRFYRIRGHEQQKKLLTEAQERINGKTH
jgi:putative resolvase